MTLHLAGADQPFAHQQLHVAMVAGTFPDAPGAQVIDTAVADVRPIGRVLLHQADRAGRAWTQFERQRSTQRRDTLVCGTERQVQEAERIELRQRVLREAVQDGALRQVGGAFAVGMAAHAIAGNQQRGLVNHGHADTVLIAVTGALKAEFCMFDPQASSGVFRYTAPRFIHH